MTIKFPSLPKIRLANPISGAKSLMRAAKHKLQPGSKRDITNVRAEDPSRAEGSTQAKQGEYAAARDCLGYLADSKGEDGNFYHQAFEKADELTDLCFKANSGKGYNAFEEIIVKDLKTWLRNYDAREVKNIAKQAEIAKGLAFIGNPDTLTEASRQRFMKKVVEACSARQKELKNLKTAPASGSNGSTAAPRVEKPKLSFREPAPTVAPVDAPSVQLEKPSQPDVAPGRNPHLVAAAKLIMQIDECDFRGFIKSLDEIGELAPEEQAMRLKAIKFAFAKQPPQPESVAIIERNLHQVLTNKTNVNTHPERVAKLWTSWLALQSAKPRQASPGPAQGLVVKDPVERSLRSLADLLVNSELYGKTRGDREKQFQSIWKLIDVDLHKSLSGKMGAADKALRAAAAAAVQDYGLEELDKLAEHLAALYQRSPTVGDRLASEIDHRARVLKTFYNECKNRKDHLINETRRPTRDEPKEAVPASTERDQWIDTTPILARNFVMAINDLNIPAFLTAVHAIGQINDSAEIAAVYEVIKSTKFDEDFQVFSIRKLNTVMESVNSKLTRDKDFRPDSREKIKQLYDRWRFLRTANRALNSKSKNPAPKEDLRVAKATLLDLANSGPISR